MKDQLLLYLLFFHLRNAIIAQNIMIIPANENLPELRRYSLAF